MNINKQNCTPDGQYLNVIWKTRINFFLCFFLDKIFYFMQMIKTNYIQWSYKSLIKRIRIMRKSSLSKCLHRNSTRNRLLKNTKLNRIFSYRILTMHCYSISIDWHFLCEFSSGVIYFEVVEKNTIEKNTINKSRRQDDFQSHWKLYEFVVMLDRICHLMENFDISIAQTYQNKWESFFEDLIFGGVVIFSNKWCNKSRLTNTTGETGLNDTLIPLDILIERKSVSIYK